MSKRLISAAELRDQLGIAARTFYTYRAMGKLPKAIRLGRTLRYKADEIDAWIVAGCPPLVEWEQIKHRNGFVF